MTTVSGDGVSPTGIPACRAPFSSLYLDPRGFARVCALNNGSPLGNIARTPLLELWRGPVAEALREAFRAGSWGGGCDVCEWQTGATTRGQSYAAVFDHLSWSDPAPWPTHLEFALGNACNLQCVMCTGDQSSSIRIHREGFPALVDPYDDAFFTDLEEIIPHLEAAKFLGGEPLLVPAHHRVWDLMLASGRDVPIHITTNATIWNDRVETVIDRLPTSFAVSMDGIRAETVERIRVGARYSIVRENLDRIHAYVLDRGTYLGLTYCLMTENWREFGEFLAFADQLDVDVYVNTVTNPGRLSLYRLPPAALTEVVAELEQQDRDFGGSLGRNHRIWVDQLDRLRTRAGGAGADLGWMQSHHERLGAPVIASADDLDDLDDLRTWAAGGPTAALELDASDTILWADGADRFLDVPVRLVGQTYDAVPSVLNSFYGRRTQARLWAKEPGHEDRSAVFETATGAIEIRSVARVLPGAEGRVRIAFAARPAVTSVAVDPPRRSA